MTERVKKLWLKKSRLAGKVVLQGDANTKNKFQVEN